MNDMEKKPSEWMVIVNPNAGSGRMMPRWEAAKALLGEKGISYRAVSPTTPQEAVRLISAACSEGQRHFMAAGGDGTVHIALQGIAGYCVKNGADLSGFYLAVLPLGSGNDFLRSHDIPAKPDLITDLINAGSFHPQDVVKVETVKAGDRSEVLNTVYMANVGGYNLDANICDVVNRRKSLGHEGKMLYARALFELCRTQKSSPARIVCDGKEVIDGLIYTVSLGNGMYSGGGMCQTPAARMDDGMLSLMIAPKFPVWKILFYIPKLFNKKIGQVPFLKFADAADVWILPRDGGQLVEIDGEVIGRAPVHFSVLTGRINVLHRG